eukprot:513711-Rhodomonas_salina.2
MAAGVFRTLMGRGWEVGWCGAAGERSPATSCPPSSVSSFVPIRASHSRPVHRFVAARSCVHHHILKQGTRRTVASCSLAGAASMSFTMSRIHGSASIPGHLPKRSVLLTNTWSPEKIVSTTGAGLKSANSVRMSRVLGVTPGKLNTRSDSIANMGGCACVAAGRTGAALLVRAAAASINHPGVLARLMGMCAVIIADVSFPSSARTTMGACAAIIRETSESPQRSAADTLKELTAVSGRGTGRAGALEYGCTSTLA